MLTKDRYITVCLRLVLNQHGVLVRGEVIGPNRRDHKSFLGWEGLVQALADWLNRFGAADS